MSIKTLTLIIGGLGILLNLLIYQQNTSKRILLVKLCSNVVWAIQDCLLGATMGFIVALIAATREATFISINRKSKFGVACLSLFAVISITSSILTWKNIYSRLPAIASITGVFSFYFSIPLVSRILAFPIATCMGLYDMETGNTIGIVNEIITVFSVIVAIIYVHVLKLNRKSNKVSQ